MEGVRLEEAEPPTVNLNLAVDDPPDFVGEVDVHRQLKQQPISILHVFVLLFQPGVNPTNLALQFALHLR